MASRKIQEYPHCDLLIYTIATVLNGSLTCLLYTSHLWTSLSKSAEERKKYDENAMCKAYGKRMMFMSCLLYTSTQGKPQESRRRNVYLAALPCEH